MRPTPSSIIENRRLLKYSSKKANKIGKLLLIEPVDDGFNNDSVVTNEAKLRERVSKFDSFRQMLSIQSLKMLLDERDVSGKEKTDMQKLE